MKKTTKNLFKVFSLAMATAMIITLFSGFTLFKTASWREAYNNVLLDIMSSKTPDSLSYVLIDLDKDKVPELVVKEESSDNAIATYNLYDCQDDAGYFVGQLATGHTNSGALYGCSDENALIYHSAYMCGEAISKITYADGEIQSELVLKREVVSAEDYVEFEELKMHNITNKEHFLLISTTFKDNNSEILKEALQNNPTVALLGAYSRNISDASLGSEGTLYVLIDLDKDEVPELIIKKNDDPIIVSYNLYDFDEEQGFYFVGKLATGHINRSSIHGCSDENALIFQRPNNGVASISKITYVDGKINTEVVLEQKDYIKFEELKMYSIFSEEDYLSLDNANPTDGNGEILKAALQAFAVTETTAEAKAEETTKAAAKTTEAAATEAPDTGDSNVISIIAAVSAVSFLAAGAFVMVSKKKKIAE